MRWYGDIFIAIDRRDGELVICRRDELGSTALAPDFVIALFKCFQDKPIRELLAYHWRQQMERDGSPLMRDLLKWIDGHFAAEQAST